MVDIKLFYTGIGKRKTSVAKVFLKEGSGIIKVNEKSFENFFSFTKEEHKLLEIPFVLVNLNNKYDLDIKVKGGGISSQMSAICLAITKSLCKVNVKYQKIFNQKLLLRRDSRIKERRKYGLKKARKAPQFSKR